MSSQRCGAHRGGQLRSRKRGAARSPWSIAGKARIDTAGRRHPMLYMVIENFRDGNPVPVYQRIRVRGRMMPAGVEYRGRWVTEDFSRCFQIMECQDRRLLDQWMANWKDVTDFEVIPVITSAEASAAMAPRL